MSTKNIVMCLLVIGALFSFAGRVSAIEKVLDISELFLPDCNAFLIKQEVECLPIDRHGPRFHVRRT